MRTDSADFSKTFLVCTAGGATQKLFFDDAPPWKRKTSWHLHHAACVRPSGHLHCVLSYGRLHRPRSSTTCVSYFNRLAWHMFSDTSVLHFELQSRILQAILVWFFTARLRSSAFTLCIWAIVSPIAPLFGPMARAAGTICCAPD